MQNAFSEGKKSVFRAASAAPPPRQLLVREVCAERGGTAAWSEAKGPARSESLPETAPLPFVRKAALVFSADPGVWRRTGTRSSTS